MSEEKHQQLNLVLSQDELFYSFDPVAMQQAIGNLLSNAIKYTPDGGNIEVRLEASPDVVKIIVCDDGVGISAENQPHIFDRFYRFPDQGEGAVD